MGFKLSKAQFDAFLKEIGKECEVYAPVCFQGGGTYSDTDLVRYGKISSIDEIVFDKKSAYSFKEVINPICQTLFFFTEEEVKVADAPRKKGAVIFLRSCDLHALKRMDDMYLKNGPTDFYYSRMRENTKFILMPCSSSFENCFCASMGTNKSDNYDMSVEIKDGEVLADCKDDGFAKILSGVGAQAQAVSPSYVKESDVSVTLPDNLTNDVIKSKMWDEYDSRCINCGRCTLVCPTCTCYTMQDIFYTDNGKVGERRRVAASCMVDGFTDVAGGGSYRKTNGQRMRFKVLHKIHDFKARSGYDMCVGCGRCDMVCPEYISFSNIINKVAEAGKEAGDE